jgi:hypothetical protein
MIFWAAVLVGGLFAWFAVKKGFYEIWAMLFNIVISVYLAIYLTPVLVEVIPASRGTPYCNALCMIVTAIGSFAVLHGISCVFLTGQFTFSFPKVFDVLFSGLLGFFAGFLVLSFAVLVVTVTPISQNEFIKDAGFSIESQQTNLLSIRKACGFVNWFVSVKDAEQTPQQAMGWLLESAKNSKPGKSEIKPDSCNETTEPNNPMRSPPPKSRPSGTRRQVPDIE